MVFVVWGSSNACGYGRQNQSPDPEDGTAYMWHRATPPADVFDLEDPFPCYEEPNPGTGDYANTGSAWPQFAYTFSDPDIGLTDHVLFMTSGAKGGSTLFDNEGNPLDWSLEPGNDLFPDGVQAIKDAMEIADEMFDDPETDVVFGGVLWNQGNDLFEVETDPYPWVGYRAALHAHLEGFAEFVLNDPTDPRLAEGRFYFINSGAYRADELTQAYYFAYDLEADVCSAYEFCSMIQESVQIKQAQLQTPGCGAGTNCNGLWNDGIHWGWKALNHVGEKTAERAAADYVGDPFLWEVGIEVPQLTLEGGYSTRLDVYHDTGTPVPDASFPIVPTVANPDWRADFDGDDGGADWQPDWGGLSTEFLTFVFVREHSSLPDEVIARYVYVPTDVAYDTGETGFFRPDTDTDAAAVRFEVFDGGVVKAGPGPGDGTDLDRLGPFFEDVFAGSYVLPYNRGIYCAAASPACPPSPPNYFLALVDDLPNATTRRFTFAEEADVLIPDDWAPLAWDVANLFLHFSDDRRLIVEGTLLADDVTLTKADGADGWGGVVFRQSAEFVSAPVNVLYESVVEYVDRDPVPGLAAPQGAVEVAGRSLTVSGGTEIRDNTDAVGLLATGTAIVNVTGLSVIRNNDGGGVLATGGAHVTVSGSSEVRDNPGGGGVRADGFNTLVELEGASILDNTGVGVRALSNADILFANDDEDPETHVQRNDGGPEAASGGMIGAGECESGETAPCDERNVHVLTENNPSDAYFDARSITGGVLFAQGNDWDETSLALLDLENDGSGVLVVCPVLGGTPCIDHRLGGGGRRGGEGGGSLRGGDVLALVEEAARAHLAGALEAFDLAALAVVAVIDTSATEDDRRAAFEASARLFAWAQPEGPLAALEDLAEETGEARPWALRALGVGRASAEDYAEARAAADTLVAAYGGSEHARYGLALSVRVAVAEREEASAVAALVALMTAFPEAEEVGPLAALVVGAFPEVDLSALRAGGASAPAAQASATLGAVSGTLLDAGEVQPNPSSSAALIPFTLGSEAQVEAALYDVLGRRVAVLASGVFPAGRHTLALDGARLPSGVYVVHLTARAGGGPAVVAVRRLTLAR
jgi:hypothetical protein